jgi:hypothetical protein
VSRAGSSTSTPWLYWSKGLQLDKHAVVVSVEETFDR